MTIRVRNQVIAAVLQHTYDALGRLTAATGRKPKQAEHLEVGVRGEELVLWHLMRLGYVVVAERWNETTLRGDLDLVAWHDEVLCFIEVKTRTTETLAPAQMAVDQVKRRTLRAIAGQYLRHIPENQRPRRTRFDIATVSMRPGEPVAIRLIENAFGWSERDDLRRSEK